MKIDLTRLPPEGMRYVGEEDPSLFSLEGEPFIRTEKPIRYNLTAHLVSHQLIVRGVVETEVLFQCSRCAEYAPRPIREPDFEWSLEVEAGCEFADLTGDIRESMILRFPAYPVCREDCRGLCPLCGINLNRQTCTCRPLPAGGWGGLDGLKIE